MIVSGFTAALDLDTYPHRNLIRPRCAERGRGKPVLIMRVYDFSRTTGYEAGYEQYQQLQCYKGKKKNVAILLKRLQSRDMA